MVADEVQLRRAHYENYKKVRSALMQSERATKYALRTRNSAMAESLKLNQMMLVSIKAEARLMKLLYLPNGFTQVDRIAVLDQNSIYESWLRTLDIAFRRRFKIKQSRSIEHALLHDDLARYNSLVGVFEKQLRPMIEIRNKLAHGQWARPLNSDKTAIEPESCKFIATETSWSLIGRDRALEGIANIVGDIIQSTALYQSRFDQHFRSVQLLTAPRRQTYEDWLAGLRKSHDVGMQRLAKNLQGS